MISVCIPNFNNEKFLGACIDSVMCQQVDAEFEVLVADDASTDNSVNLVREKQAIYGSRLRLVQQKMNTRQTGNQNILDLYASAKGDYLCRIDSDDLMLPGRLQKQLNALRQHQDCVIVYGDARAFDTETNATQYFFNSHYYNSASIPQISNLKHLVMYGTYLCTPSSMHRRTALHLDELEQLYRELSHYLDLAFHISAAARGNILRLDDVVTDYRIHKQSVCAKVREQSSLRIRAHRSHQLVIENARRYTDDEQCIAIGHAGNDLSAALFFFKSGDMELYQRYMEASGKHGVFLNERHESIYRVRHQRDAVANFLN